ncbi:NAD-dependent epimerase/dehydratase family protein [Actinoplanes sp. TBRC 11911]|uniref:NAD-dependent epimerase/dehydratase family protein n=1 Tax=Actinoplanes sp. TBRC 11911 TaxID=2729386 RepID=UPI00145ECAAD|nr:NAD-dependent epimerase/dehydratase family protein [Actinoplanes sp. TBRC 11911]NMO55220.1 NAD-dependent epimerase/dehydratase family protein [Actinoplanes sp. TBRC 11911]
MKVLVSGGAGLIGRHTVRLLLAHGQSVVVLDDLRLGKYDELPAGDGLEFRQGSVTDRATVSAALRDVDAVIHLAAPSSFLMYEQDVVGATIGTTASFVILLEEMRRAGIGKLVYASTSAVYESNPVPYREGMPLSPLDMKALSKKWGEEAAQYYSDRYGIRAVGLRPFSVYGVGESAKAGYANIVTLFVWAMTNGYRPVVWGDGLQTRDYLYAADMAEALWLALCSDLPSQCFNAGTGIETSFIEVIATINEELGSSLEPLHVEVPSGIYARRLVADTTRQRDVLGFTPRISLREGIRRLIAEARSFADRGTDLGVHQHFFERLAADKTLHR